MMKRIHLFHVIVWIAILLIICLLSPLNFRGVLPSGTIIAPITALLAITVIPLLGMLSSTLLIIASQLILLLVNQSDWLTVVVTALTALFSGWVVRWQQASSQELRHQQMLTIGICSGLIILFLLEIAYLIVGWRLTGNGGGMLEVARLALPISLLTGLCYALLIPPLSILLMQIGKRWLPKARSNQNSKDESVIIDLSKHEKDKNNQN
ncbi:MAG: hypothetical protein LKJ51_04435 [Limosilactobacillus sp.]|uniref:hypothetical protein n=1 Tax=Limosilactobacillus sp. TaxID=2773925 RepID=UPI0025C33C24|nr:hypothetical protein [Limosilactobacillus sp.]MCI1975155.1 hypothetical protein [Limosilactobacillus sp.]MCI2031755.1 hypothetical protein [Limosilactobacillus sp.]